MEAFIWHKLNSSAIILPMSLSDTYYQALLTVYTLGALGNIISIMVFSRKTFHGSVSTLSHQMLCMLETVYMGIVTWGVTIIHHKIILTKSMCLALFYIMHVTNIICNWMVILVTIERLTSVILPLQVRILWTKKRLLMVFFTLSVITLVVYSGLFIMGTTLDSLGTNSSRVFSCMTHYKDVNLETARAWLEITFMHSLPCLILVIGNGLIIVCLWRHKALLNRHNASQRTQRLPSMQSNDPFNNNLEEGHLVSVITTHRSFNDLSSISTATNETGDNKELTSNIELHINLNCKTMDKLDQDTPPIHSQILNASLRQQSVQTVQQTELLRTLNQATISHFDNEVVMKGTPQPQIKSNPAKQMDATRNAGQRHRKMSQQSQNGQLRRERAMTLTLLLINFTFLGTKMPYFIYSTTLPGFPDNTVVALPDAELKVHFVILASLFNAVSFILYCLAGSKFREELTKMICGAVVKAKHLCKT